MTDTMLTCDQLDALLPDYLEGTLGDTECAAVERHARGCARCGALLSDLAAITHHAARLTDLAPSRDLWAGIEARIETPIVSLAPARGAERGRRRWGAPWLAAAAALLVAASTGITFLATRHHYAPSVGTVAVAPSPTRPAAIAAPATASDSHDSLVRPAPRAPRPGTSRPEFASRRAAPVDRVYDAEIARLAAILHERRSQLDPATVAVVEKNLRIIDQAIAQSRAALSKDPASHLLNDQLNSALDQKVELLRTVALLPSRT